MIYKITDNVVIDNHGYRVLENGIPINYKKLPLAELSEIEIESALIFVQFLEHHNIYTINSYSLKHDVERFLRSGTHKSKKGKAYISNGALIVAMIKQGFKYQLISLSKNPLKEYLSVDLIFNVSARHYKAVLSNI